MKRYCVFASIVWLSVIPFAAAQTTYWTGTGTGWSGAGSWSAGEPTASIRAGVNFGTATVTDPGEICKSLQLGGGAGNWNGSLAMSSGSVEIINQLTVGYVGTGTVTLTGGLLKAASIVISVFNNTPCTMDVSGDAEVQCQYLEVGWPGKGYLTQNGGTINAGELALTNNNDDMRGEGYYTLNGGTLNVGAIYVGIIKGEWKITNPGVDVHISDGLDIRPNGAIDFPPGTFFHMNDNAIPPTRTGDFRISKTRLAGAEDLINLTLSFDGTVPASTGEIEAACKDLGQTTAGFDDSFTLGALYLGPNARVSLVNQVDNTADWNGVEALYVRHIRLGQGAVLNCNCLPLYYETIENLGGTILEGNCYHLELTANQARYRNIPGRADDRQITFPCSYPSSAGPVWFDNPCATLFGVTAIPITIRLTGSNINNRLIHLASQMKDAYSEHIVFPATVTTNANGEATFDLSVLNIYEDLLEPAVLDGDGRGPWKIDLKAWLDGKELEVNDAMDFDLFNNYRAIRSTFETNTPDGHIWDMSDPFNAIQWPVYWPLFVSGTWAGDINNMFDSVWSIENWATGLRKSPYGSSTCGCYQLTTLEIWDKMRLNLAWSDASDWLLNGFHYGPVKVGGGFHNAAMLWPQNQEWRNADWCTVFDAWIAQKAEGAEYPILQWVQNMGIVVPVVGYIMDIWLSPGSSYDLANNAYPPNSFPYPLVDRYPKAVISDPTKCEGERVPIVSITLACPVHVQVSNDAGQRVGVIPDTPEGEMPYVCEIAGADFYPQRLPDGSMAYGFHIPRQKLNIDIWGYEDSDFTVFVQDGNGKVFGYSDVPINQDQHTVADLEPDSLRAPAIVYPDGSRILPDGVIAIESWRYDVGQHRLKGTLTITNTTGTAVQGPLRLIVESTTPGTIQLIGADGTDGGKGYLDLTALLGDGRLDPGESVIRTIEFSNPNREYFDLSVKLTGRTAEDKTVTARRKFNQVGIPQCSREGLVPFDLAEGNAADWETWAEGMAPEGTFVFDDTGTRAAGNSSVMCMTDAPFDMYIRYGKTLETPWDLSKTKNLFISFYARNDNFSFQNGSPWIRLKTDDNNYYQFQYFLDGNPYDLLNDCLWQWKPQIIALDALETEENGWRRTTVGSPDRSQIRYLEIHADTWDAGFQLGVDGVGFDTDQAIYRDFNADCSVDTLDLLTLVKYWLCSDCTPTACEGADIDLSGKVDLADFALFAEAWLEE